MLRSYGPRYTVPSRSRLQFRFPVGFVERLFDQRLSKFTHLKTRNLETSLFTLHFDFTHETPSRHLQLSTDLLYCSTYHNSHSIKNGKSLCFLRRLHRRQGCRPHRLHPLCRYDSARSIFVKVEKSPNSYHSSLLRKISHHNCARRRCPQDCREFQVSLHR